jgi:hypothetical protein
VESSPSGYEKTPTVTLAQAGIDKNLAHRARTFSLRGITAPKKNISALRASCGDRNGSALDCARKGAAVMILVACNPVKKHGPWVVAHLRVVTPSGDPV